MGTLMLRVAFKSVCGTRSAANTKAAAYGGTRDMHEVEPLAQWEAQGDSRLAPDPSSAYTSTTPGVSHAVRRDFRDDVFYSVPSSLDPDFDSAADSMHDDDPFGVGEGSGRRAEGEESSGRGLFSFISGAWRGRNSDSAERHRQGTGSDDRNRLYAL